MKDCMNLIKERRRLFLFMLMGTVVFTLYMSFLNMNVLLDNDMTRLLENDVTQEELVTYLETEPTELMLGIDNGSLIPDYFFQQFSEYLFLCFILAICIWITFLGTDSEKGKAFVEMLPGTRMAKEMAGFLPLLGILLINCLVGIVSTLVQLTVRNNEILGLERSFPQLLSGRISPTLVADANIAFLQQSLMLTGFLVGTFLFYYFCSMLTKRRAVGVIFGAIFKIVWPQVIYYFMMLFNIDSDDGILYMIPDGIAGLSPMYHCCEGVWNLPMILLLIAFCALLVVGIVVNCRTRELSKGGFCYSRVAEVLIIGFAVELAMMMVTEVFSLFLIYGDMETIELTIRVVGIIAVLVGVAVTVLIAYEMYHKRDKIKSVEVGNSASISGAWFRMDMKAYCFGFSVISAIALLIYHQSVGWETNLLLSMFREGYRDVDSIENMLRIFRPLESFTSIMEYYLVPGFVIACVMFFMVVKQGKTERRSTRDFLETLPVPRNKRFVQDIMKDILLGAIPLTITSLYSLIQVVRVAGEIGTVAYGEIPNLLIWYGIELCLLIGCVGCMRFIDVITVHPNMKFLYTLLFFTMMGLWRIIIDEKVLKFSYESSFKVTAVVLLACGILFLWAAYVLYRKREYSSEKFFFKFAAYGFVMLIVCCYVSFLILGYNFMNKVMFYVCLIVGATALFLVFGNKYIPEIRDLFGKAEIKKQNKK